MVSPNKEPQPTTEGLPNNELTEDPKNRVTTRMPDGSFVNWDFTEGKEHVTFQHKSGSSVQMQTDGSVKIVSAAGKMGIEINGEGYMTITGAYNIEVKGGASFRVERNADWWVGGDMNMKVNGTLTTMAKNMNFVTGEKLDIAATDTTLKSANGTKVSAGGAMEIASADGMTITDPTAVRIN